MVPVNAITSICSVRFYRHALYWAIFQGSYQAVVLLSFYDLIRFSLAPTLREQKVHIQEISVKNWTWPVKWLQTCTGGSEKGLLKRPRNGLLWFNVREKKFQGYQKLSYELLDYLFCDLSVHILRSFWNNNCRGRPTLQQILSE
jgi:Organic solute transporter Ostalpha